MLHAANNERKQPILNSINIVIRYKNTQQYTIICKKTNGIWNMEYEWTFQSTHLWLWFQVLSIRHS